MFRRVSVASLQGRKVSVFRKGFDGKVGQVLHASNGTSGKIVEGFSGRVEGYP